LIVAKAFVAKVLGKLFAVLNRFHIPLMYQSGVSGFVPNVTPQPFFASEQRT
jgi:hypothetical protein